MDKKQAVSFVMKLDPGKSTPGLEKISRFLGKAGNPQDSFQSIIVSGTNGKGSTVQYISNILMEAGYKVGAYTSPFLEDFNERIVVNGKKIGNKELAVLVGETKKQVEEFRIKLSFFEFVTVLAFKHFARKEVDVAVLEVGMGGRLDATNVAENVLGCAITNIALEHTQWLGRTRKKIAFEKAGIIKENSVLVTTELDPKIRKVFEKKCLQNNSGFYFFPKHFSFKQKFFDSEKQVFDFWFGKAKIADLEIGLLGRHQLYNASLAVALLVCLRKKLFFSKKDIVNGLRKTRWLGRFETVRKKPLVVFDACHNPAGVRVFRETFEQNFPKEKAVIVFGCSSDKDVRRMLREIRPVAESLIVCSAKWRGMKTKKIGKIAKKTGFGKISCIDSVQSAVKSALREKKKIVCVLGSIFVLGEAKKLFKNVEQ